MAMESEPGVRMGEEAEARVVVVEVRFGGGVWGADSSSRAAGFDGDGCCGRESVGYEGGRLPRPFNRALSFRFLAKSMFLSYTPWAGLG